MRYEYGQSVDDRFAALAVAVLLILTAWGNAVAMLVISALGLVVGLVLFRRSNTRGGFLAAIVGLVVAVAMVPLVLLR